jgi:hypothetical protein
MVDSTERLHVKGNIMASAGNGEQSLSLSLSLSLTHNEFALIRVGSVFRSHRKTDPAISEASVAAKRCGNRPSKDWMTRCDATTHAAALGGAPHKRSAERYLPGS